MVENTFNGHITWLGVVHIVELIVICGLAWISHNFLLGKLYKNIKRLEKEIAELKKLKQKREENNK